jgi:two-component system sensor histidine kinase DevS
VTSEDLPIRDLLDSAPDGFVVVDEHGTIVFVNRTAAELFRYAPGELDGSPVSRLIPKRLHEAHHGHRTAYVEDPRVRPMGLGLDLVGCRKDGSEFPVEISLSPLKTEGRLLFTAVVRDVTERTRLEDERNALAAELEMERERDRIAMDLHDGIMQDIYAAALTLELAQPEPGQSPEPGVIERAIDHLHGVVRDIRSYIFDLRPREFSGDLAEGVANLANEFKQNSQIPTSIEIDAEVPADVETSFAVYNIAHESLSNIQRHAGASHVSVTLRREGDAGVLEVSDDGAGFDTTVTLNEGHRGLRNMVSRAQGVNAELDVHSAPGQGTRLCLRFPAGKVVIP